MPVLDWRKGERYHRAPDGTIIGKEGFDFLVFNDEIWKKNQTKEQNKKLRHRLPASAITRAAFRRPFEKRETSIPELLSASEDMEQKSSSHFSLGGMQSMHRHEGRNRSVLDDPHESIMGPSFSSYPGLVADPDLKTGTQADNGSVLLQASEAAQYSISMEVYGNEERVLEEDVLFEEDAGPSCSIINISTK